MVSHARAHYPEVVATDYILGQVAIGSDFSGLALRWLHNVRLRLILLEVVLFACARESWRYGNKVLMEVVRKGKHERGRHHTIYTDDVAWWFAFCAPI